MPTFVDAAASVLAQAERRTEIAAQNVANIATPGFKRRVAFSNFVDTLNSATNLGSSTGEYSDLSIGKIVGTDNPLDVALTGRGLFVVQTPSGLQYTRQGQFKRDADGRIVTLDGHPVQNQGGGDIVLKSSKVSIAADGTVTDSGEPVGKLWVVDVANRAALGRTSDGLFTVNSSAVKDVDAPAMRQAALESSNVSTADDMVSVMEAMRRAESAHRLVNVYDDLLGRALSTFGQP